MNAETSHTLSFSQPTLSVGQSATLACLLEISAPKPGNVHRGADFEDAGFVDFAASAVAIGPVVERANDVGVGPTALAAIRATRTVTRTNTNLGTVLLLAPLAAIGSARPTSQSVATVLDNLTADDACDVYQAIQLAQAGGLGEVAELDVRDAPPEDLLQAMAAAADRDLVARQYVNGLHEVFELIVPALLEGMQSGWTLNTSIIHTQLLAMSRHSDSLVLRKCGPAIADQLTARASAILEHVNPTSPAYTQGLADLDFWMRSDGHRRNPGTTADLIAAGLFILIRDGRLRAPFS
ncbi:MAG: triphosphoribosyl-dephospho-CoA synthase [Planctomycetota bacterium]|nr:triphosphoribosyl-dephospho-CoA synthase [Planctomycetota bacterium]